MPAALKIQLSAPQISINIYTPPNKPGKVSSLVRKLNTAAKDAKSFGSTQTHLTHALQFQTLTTSACLTQPRNNLSIFCSCRTTGIKTTVPRTMNNQLTGSSMATTFGIPRSKDTSVTDPTLIYMCPQSLCAWDQVAGLVP